MHDVLARREKLDLGVVDPADVVELVDEDVSLDTVPREEDEVSFVVARLQTERNGEVCGSAQPRAMVKLAQQRVRLDFLTVA